MRQSEKFLIRYEKLLKETPDFTISLARYAKDKIALKFVSDGSGWKTSAIYLADSILGKGEWEIYKRCPGWSNREGAYILSLGQVEKFLKAYSE